MKPIWRSKTFWFNFGTGMVSLGTEFAFVADFLPEEYEAMTRIGLASFVAIGNVILRTVTAEPVRWR